MKIQAMRKLKKIANICVASLVALVAGAAWAEGKWWNESVSEGDWASSDNWWDGDAPYILGSAANITFAEANNYSSSDVKVGHSGGGATVYWTGADAEKGLSFNSLWVGFSDGTYTYPGILSIGTGAWTANSYTYIGNEAAGDFTLTGGTYTQNGGIFVVGHGNAAGTATISGGTLNLTSGYKDATIIDDNVSLYIGENSGTGTMTISGGNVNITEKSLVGIRSKGTLNISGGTLTASKEMRVGGTDNATGEGVLDVSGGKFYANGGLTVARGGTGTVTISGDGEVIVPANGNTFWFGAGSSGTINLNGGLLAIPHRNGWTGGNTINFNGGTLRAQESSTSFLDTAVSITVDTNGGTIDTNGKEITISSAVTGTGTLTKTGSGTLTLSATPDNTVNFNLQAGMLVLPAGYTGTVATDVVGKKVYNNNGTYTLVGADEYIWAGAADANWSDGANWYGGSAPSSTDSVIFPDGASVALNGSNVEVASITGNGALTITGYGDIAVSGEVNVAGALTFTPNVYNSGNSSDTYQLNLTAKAVMAGSLNGVAIISTSSGVTSGGGTFYGRITGVGGFTVNGQISMYGLNDFSGNLTVNEGKILYFVSSLTGLTPLVRLDASVVDSYICDDGTGCVTSWTSQANNYVFNNPDSLMTVTEDYFSADGTKRKSILTQKSQLTASMGGGDSSHIQSIVGAICLVERLSEQYGGPMLLSITSSDEKYQNTWKNRRIGERSKQGYWTKQTAGSSSDETGIWQNGVYADKTFHYDSRIFSVVGFPRYALTYEEHIGGTHANIAIGELLGFTGNPSHAQIKQVETYLANKWRIGGTSVPAVNVTLADGAVIDLGGTSQTVASLSGSGTVQNGKLIVSGQISVTAGATLTIPAGSTYGSLADGVTATEENGVITFSGSHVWIGGAEPNQDGSYNWADAENWADGIVPNAATAKVLFPDSAAGVKVVGANAVRTGEMTIRGNVTLTGSFTLDTITGADSLALTLDSVTLSKGATSEFNVPVVIVNSVVNSSNNVLTFNKSVSGDGNISNSATGGSAWSGFAFKGDVTNFTGSYTGAMRADYTRDCTELYASKLGTGASARWRIGNNNGKSALKENGEYHFGQLTGDAFTLKGMSDTTLYIGELANAGDSTVAFANVGTNNKVVKEGSAKLSLSGAIAALDVNGGTVALTSTSLPADINLVGDVTLEFAADINSDSALDISCEPAESKDPSISVAAAKTAVLANTFSDITHFTKTGAGALELTVAPGWSGTTKVTGGTLILPANTSVPYDSETSGVMTLSDGRVMYYSLTAVNFWTGGGTKTDGEYLWSDVNNWSLGSAPAADSIVIFNPSVDTEELVIACNGSDCYTGYLTINRDIILKGTGATITTVNGEGKLTIESAAASTFNLYRFGSYSINTDVCMNGSIYNDTDACLKINGSFTGNATISHNNSNGQTGFHFYGDTHLFSGSYTGGNRNKGDRDGTRFYGSSLGSPLAEWDIGYDGSSSGNRPFQHSGRYQFGALKTHGGNHLSVGPAVEVTIEVGDKADGLSTVGGTLRDDSNTFRKVGTTSTCDLTLTESKGTVEIKEGSLNLAGSLPTVIKFTGGTLKTALDPSGCIENSSSAIVVDVGSSESPEWATALASTNKGGLTKKGAGSLILSQPPAYTGATTVEEGELYVPAGTTLTRGNDTHKVPSDKANYDKYIHTTASGFLLMAF